MKKIIVKQYDAFSIKPGKGNPAGIVLDADNLTDEEMQEIASKVGFNECAFPVKSNVADLRIRYFTPGHEMDLCGHATMATIFALVTEKYIEFKRNLTIETKAGILSIQLTEEQKTYHMRMEHAKPRFKPFGGSIKDLATSIGITIEDIHAEYPIVYGNTGIWTLCIPIKNMDAFAKMEPKTTTFPSILKEMPNASLHPFSLKAFSEDADMHARHFSSPISGTIQDAVTGTASGVMGAYVATYLLPERKGQYDLIVEQGQELDKDGRVIVHVENNEDITIAITGTAVYVKDIAVYI
ncbi:PhzF family phenazine biosynthesis isomerase [Viridibacillus sp. NPDC093762]|uniref:PhzF family phenazine biosynthesis isomerase n=1 Tax=Viridibacillus sp. NPDC093762 TaxID=3390720 RepID=UPI003CFEEC64